MKTGVYSAHDDDSILGLGGRIAQHIKNNDDVYVVVCNPGMNAYIVNFNINENPSPNELRMTRKNEIINALKILGVKKERLYFLDLNKKNKRVRENMEKAKEQLLEITKKEKPDIVYFHHPDTHKDHRAVNKIMIEILDEIHKKPEAFEFIIWTKELAKGRNDVNENFVLEIKGNIIKININKELEMKKKAIMQMKSQVEKHPYPEWQKLKNPVLDKKFIGYFLKENENFVKVE
ncbi:MAG: PIG-L family deacetylase [Candidatus Nanoarchaeia archaeon]|nr:PIG-L family deacetylase [Candidatus Nanoarchaeia archaeon]